MMKGVLNICAVFMAALLCVSAVGIPKVSAENNTSGNKSETQLSSVVPAENSYSAYIGHHSSAAPGSGTVTADLAVYSFQKQQKVLLQFKTRAYIISE